MAAFNPTGAFLAGAIGIGGFVLIKGAINGLTARFNSSGKSLEQSVTDTVSGFGGNNGGA